MIDNRAISISLFTGAGGLDIGMEQAGFPVVSIVEKDPDAAKTIALNRPDLNSAVSRDIQNISAQNLFEEGGRIIDLGRPLRPCEVDLVTGGPPCQPFSTAGKRGSVIDPRGSLFMDFIRIVEEVQPRFFVMENVKGLLSAPIRHRPHLERGPNYPPLELDEIQGSALEVVLGEMKRLGYRVVYSLLEAADYGVPQNRQRVIFIGSREIRYLFVRSHSYFRVQSTASVCSSSFRRNSQGVAPKALATSKNSTTSKRRSPRSYLETKDCGFCSLFATSACVSFLDWRVSISSKRNK